MKCKATQGYQNQSALPVRLTGGPRVFNERQLDKVVLDLPYAFEPLGGGFVRGRVSLSRVALRVETAPSIAGLSVPQPNLEAKVRAVVISM